MGNKDISLDGIMYNEDGSFIPLTGNNGNIDGELSDLRNTYLESEKKYFEHLLSDPDIFVQFKSLLDESADALFDYAVKFQQSLENGELETPEDLAKMANMSPEERDQFHMNKLIKAEGFMCLLFAAARDKVRIKELILEQGGRTK